MAGISSSLTTVPVTDIKITNLPLTDADTEYPFPLTLSCKSIEISARGKSTLRISFTMGDSGTVYKTIPRGSSWAISAFSFASKTLYIQASLPGDVVEIVELF